MLYPPLWFLSVFPFFLPILFRFRSIIVGIALIAFFQLLGGAFDFLSVKILLDYQQLVIEEKEKVSSNE